LGIGESALNENKLPPTWGLLPCRLTLGNISFCFVY